MHQESDDGDRNQVDAERVIISVSLPLELKTRAESEIPNVSADSRSALIRDALRAYITDGDQTQQPPASDD